MLTVGLQAANQSHVYISHDRGLSWAQSATVPGQYWSTLFVHNATSDLFLLGTTSDGGPDSSNGIGISRSRDGGRTWAHQVRRSVNILLLLAGLMAPAARAAGGRGSIGRQLHSGSKPACELLSRSDEPCWMRAAAQGSSAHTLAARAAPASHAAVRSKSATADTKKRLCCSWLSCNRGMRFGRHCMVAVHSHDRLRLLLKSSFQPVLLPQVLWFATGYPLLSRPQSSYSPLAAHCEARPWGE